MCSDYRVVVLELKAGFAGNEDACKRIAKFLQKRSRASPYERFVAVLSTKETTRHEISKTSGHDTEFPRGRIFDLLSATGELRCLALLSLRLERAGISAVALNIHEAGVQLVSRDTDSNIGIKVEPRRLQEALSQYCVVAVSGSFATNSDGSIVSLGRDGPDLSAIALAQSLGAYRWEIITKLSRSFESDSCAASTSAKKSDFSDGIDSVAFQTATAARIPLLVRDRH